MFDLSPLAIGTILTITGVFFIALIPILLRISPQRQPTTSPLNNPALEIALHEHAEAVLLVQTGGRLVYLNQYAREWFEAQDGEPNLEQLARRARPSDAFLKLCAVQGKAQFSLSGRAVEGTSYRVPYGKSHATLVSLRRPKLVVEADDFLASSTAATLIPALDLFAEFSESIAADLDLDKTLDAIINGVQKLIPADSIEITILDNDQSTFSSYRLVDTGDDKPKLEKSLDHHPTDRGYTGHIYRNRKPLLVRDTRDFRTAKPDISRQVFPLNAYLGVPLLAANKLVGTIELGSLDKDSFSENDLETLQFISRQAAITLHNALLYQAEERRAQELAGLAQLAQATSTLDKPSELFSQLIGSIQPLLKVEILGFLIYDGSRHSLFGQQPFFGLQANVIEWAKINLEPGSEAESIWQSGQTIASNQASDDPQVQALGLHLLAQAAGIQHLVLVPLAAGGRMLGYLLTADKLDDTGFDRTDLRLLTIIAGQIAPLVENSALLQQSRRRAQRAETLRRIASLTSSTATLDEILKFSLQDLARLLRADHAAIFLLDEQRGELLLHKASMFGVRSDLATRLGRLPIDDPQFQYTVTGSSRAYIGSNVQEDSRILPIYRPLIVNLNIHSAIVVPLVVRDRGIGEIMVGSHQHDFFDRGDFQSTTTAAGQLASAIEQATLYNQTDGSLQRRVAQMTALTRISRELNTTLDLRHLLQRVYDEVLQTTAADCGTILLFELYQAPYFSENAQNPEIALYLGDTPGETLHPLEKAVLKNADTIIIPDYEQTLDLRQLSAEPAPHPAHAGIRSAMVVPIAYQEQVAGLIHVHSKKPNCFDHAAQEVAEALAIQAAIALGNAHRYQEQIRRNELLNRRVDTLGKLFEISQGLNLERPLEDGLENIAYAIQSTTAFNTVLISVFDPQRQVFVQVAGAGISLATMKELKANLQPRESIEKILEPRFQISRSYFIPHGKLSQKSPGLHSISAVSDSGEDHNHTDNDWHPDDILVVPLQDSHGQPLGLIRTDTPRDNLRPDHTTIETLEIFGSQAALLIESQAKLRALEANYNQAQRQLQQNQQAADAVQNQIPSLLQKDVEQTLTIQRLSQRAHHIRTVMQVAKSLVSGTDRASVLEILGKEILAQLEMDAVLIVEPSHHGHNLLFTLGNIPKEANIEALLGQRNPLTHCLRGGQLLLSSQPDELDGWESSALLQALHAKSFIALPIRHTASKPSAAVLATSRHPMVPHIYEDTQVYTLLANQAAITLQNINLITETSVRLSEVNLLLDFSRQLGSLDPHEILTSLAKIALQVVPSAHTCLVATWDAKQNQLVPQAVSGYPHPEKMMGITYQPADSLPGKVFASGEAICLAEVDFAQAYDLPREHLLRYRDATDGRLPVSSLAVPIIRHADSESLGVIVLDNYQTTAAFSSENQALITSLAQQTALNLENTRLYQAAASRANQLQALTAAAATMTAKLQPDDLAESLLDQLTKIIPFDTSTLWLRQGEQVMVRAALGFSDDEERIGLVTAIDDSALLNEMLFTGQAILVPDVRVDSRFPALFEPAHLSWLGLPLISSGEVSGVIALEKREANYYSTEDIQIAMAFAGQAAVALDNARLFQESLRRAAELDERSNRLELLHRLSTSLGETLNQERILEITNKTLGQTLPCSGVATILFDEQSKAILAAVGPVSTGELPQSLPDSPLFERIRQSLGAFITTKANEEVELKPLKEFLTRHKVQSLLALPLATGSDLHGVQMIFNEQPHRFSADEVELGRTIANQAGIAIQNARLYAQTRAFSEELEQRVVQRTAELAREHKKTQTLLRVITELSSSLDLEQVLNRTLRLVNEVVDAGQITVLIVRPGEDKLYRLASLGYAEPAHYGGTPTSLNLNQGLAGWVLNSQQAALIDDVRQDPRWILLEDAPQPQHRSAMAVPLMVGAETLGVLMLYHEHSGHFSNDQLELVQAAANQIAIAINNAELYRLIRDQAEDLGNMFRSQQIEASRSRAILEAVADGVLVTDTQRTVTLFNASAEQILKLKRTEVIGKSLEHFTGLFGRAARSWMETIYTWSADPMAYQEAEIYAEQITLEDERVVSVSLAPVRLRDDFLGTVSVFRDITHLVELDRLKSEFVATVSHELRTPMTSIKGFTEVLLMGAAGSLNDQQAHFLNVVKENTERLAILVDDLLDISRIEAGKAFLSLQPLDPRETIQNCVADFKQRTARDKKPMTFEIIAPPQIPLIHADPARVRQIVVNLLENAYHYTPAQGLVTIQLQTTGNEVQVDVKDNGIGIPIENQARVFERFYRGEHPFVLKTSGTGLGLSIVHRLVEMHEGRIWLESSGIPGEGSTFSFTIPVYTAPIKVKLEE